MLTLLHNIQQVMTIPFLYSKGSEKFRGKVGFTFGHSTDIRQKPFKIVKINNELIVTET